MDFDFIFWLAIAVVYLFQFILGKKKRDAASQSPLPELESEPSDHPAEFRDALSEISRMLSGETAPRPQPAQKPLPAPKTLSAPTSLSVPKSLHATSKNTSVLRTQKAGLPQVTRSRESSFYDEEFEKRDYVDFHAPKITHVKTSAPIAQKTRETLTVTAKRDIHDFAKAQEALVLAEVLGPPVSKRRGRRRI